MFLNSLIASMLFLVSLSACATPGSPRAYFDEDMYARYYGTSQDRVLRVDRDGTIMDVTCLAPVMVRGHERQDIASAMCPDGRVETIGKIRLEGEAWDLSAYAVTPETGTCRALFGAFQNEWLAAKRHSCWNRLWEVPAAVVAYPVMAVLAIGGVTAPMWAPLLLL